MDSVMHSNMRANMHYDGLETRAPEQRENALFKALSSQLLHAKQHAPYFAAQLANHDVAQVNSREALAQLPVTRKSALIALQAANPPFGGLNATPIGKLANIFVSPGPIYDPEGVGDDWWCTARAFYAAGFRANDLVHNTFSYHLTPAGSMFDTGLRALGCCVIAGGVGQTEMQLTTIAALKPSGYVGTPSFLKLLLEKAAAQGIDISSIRRALVSGEAFLPATQRYFAECGIEAMQCYGTADLGIIAYETSARDGLMVEENRIVEIVRPGTGDVLPDGEVGEVVVTTFNRDYPLVRFATGDLSAVLKGISPCGRTNMRIRGWLGRADQTTKVRGMFIHPEQIAAVLKRHPQIIKACLTVSHDASEQDQMVLRCEATGALNTQGIADDLRDLTKLRGSVEKVAAGVLANNGKVIEDVRGS
jgi:phenylacetate-CoA ligase